MHKITRHKDLIKAGLKILMVINFGLLCEGILIFSTKESLAPLLITAVVLIVILIINWLLRHDDAPAPTLTKPQPREQRGRHRRAIGIRNASDAKYRESQLARFDRWTIQRWKNDEGLRTYVPAPLWDDEAALTRQAFDSLEQAQNYVREVGGQLAD